MDPLRISLLLIGLVVIGAIYWFGSRRRRREEDAALYTLPEEADGGDAEGWDNVDLDTGEEPPLSTEQLEALTGLKQSREVPLEESDTLHTSPKEAPPAESQAPEEALLAITVLATEPDRPFTGPAISEAMDRLDLPFGEMQVFEGRDPASGRALFYVANILEPGVFTLATLPELKSPGLALFTPLPGPVPGPEALQAMLRAAEALAGELGGRLADKERRPLTRKQLDRLAAIAVQFSAAKRAES